MDWLFKMIDDMRAKLEENKDVWSAGRVFGYEQAISDAELIVKAEHISVSERLNEEKMNECCGCGKDIPKEKDNCSECERLVKQNQEYPPQEKGDKK